MYVIAFLFTAATAIPAAIVLGSVGAMLFVLAAAAWASRTAAVIPVDEISLSTRFVVLIPAHDEEAVLATTLRSVEALQYPKELFEIVVIADNCTDTTAEIARGHGALVLERTDGEKRGKGHALAWAMQQLLKQERPADAFVIIDADTWVAPDFLVQASLGLARSTDTAGRSALQGRYGVLNSNDGWRATLMAAAFELFNHVKPLGRDFLGLSVSLQGNGMIFSRRLLEQARWSGDSITEDIDFGLDLAQKHNTRVGYLPSARVRAQMPVTAEQARSQRERWEGGRYRLIRTRAVPLLVDGLKKRSLLLTDAAVNLLLPPLAEIGALWLLGSGLIVAGLKWHLLLFPVFWQVVAILSGIGLVVYVLGGLSVAGAPREAYFALLRAPFYAAWKLLLYIRPSRRSRSGKEPEWVRTTRIPDEGEATGSSTGSSR